MKEGILFERRIDYYINQFERRIDYYINQFERTIDYYINQLERTIDYYINQFERIDYILINLKGKLIIILINLEEDINVTSLTIAVLYSNKKETKIYAVEKDNFVLLNMTATLTIFQNLKTNHS